MRTALQVHEKSETPVQNEVPRVRAVQDLAAGEPPPPLVEDPGERGAFARVGEDGEVPESRGSGQCVRGGEGEREKGREGERERGREGERPVYERDRG